MNKNDYKLHPGAQAAAGCMFLVGVIITMGLLTLLFYFIFGG
jgi:hypothetical protein